MALTRRQLLLVMILRRRLRKKNQNFVGRLWVRKIYEERKEKGEFHLLIQEMKLFDHQYFYQQCRMSPPKFEELLNLVARGLRSALYRGNQLVLVSDYVVLCVI